MEVAERSLRVLIADDESLARERLRQMLVAEPNIEIIGECADGRTTVEVILRESPDIVFLDVKMPEFDGFQVVEALESDRLPLIILVTAFDQFALPAFDAHVFDFLLKPFDRERFRQALHRARQQLAASILDSEVIKNRFGRLLAALPPSPVSHRRLALKSDGRFVFVGLDEIIWISAATNQIELHLAKSVVRLRQTIAAFEKRLPESQFARVNRSTIVNLDHIREIRPKSHGDYFIFLDEGTRICASRTHRGNLLRFLGPATSLAEESG